MKAAIVSLLLLFFGISSYCQSEAEKRKAKLSMTGAVMDDTPAAPGTPIYNARYRGKKNDLEKYVKANITAFVVECITNNADTRKFIDRDQVSFYFTLSERGDIESVHKVTATFSLTAENKAFLSKQIIGMQNWKPKKSKPDVVYVWTIPFEWV